MPVGRLPPLSHPCGPSLLPRDGYEFTRAGAFGALLPFVVYSIRVGKVPEDNLVGAQGAVHKLTMLLNPMSESTFDLHNIVM